MSNIKFAELDFFEIKENLKTFLKSQDHFKDFDFDGSSLSTLLDVLAYNTAYNTFYLNMLASEMFLDSAGMRDSVVSRAKHLGYVPKSVHSLRTKVDLEFVLSVPEQDQYNQIPQSILVTQNDEIYCVIDGSKYNFTPMTSVYLENPTRERFVTKSGKPMIKATFKATNIEFIEGRRLNHSWVVDTTLPVKQRFIIPNEDVDITSILVTVKENEQSTNAALYLPFDDLNTLKPNDLTYYIQEVPGNKYEIVFGNDVLGKQPKDGNIININYVISSGDGARNASVFRVSGAMGGVKSESIFVKTVEPAGNYNAAESIESIKFFAPRAYDAQNRAVTKSDYETLLKREIPSIEYLRVWGGEENLPPEYGKVFCAIKPKTGRALSTDDKSRLINTYIKPRNVLSIQVELVEPDYLGLIINSQINYFSNKTYKPKDKIKNDVVKIIQQYREQNLIGFDSDFRYSKLVKQIDSVDASIESNITDVKIKYRLIPAFDTPSTYYIYLNNPIDRGDAANENPSILSTPFIYNNIFAYLSDDGKGKLYVYYTSNDQKIIIQPNAGSVNYETGTIVIQNLVVTNIPNSFNYIDINITPAKNDIIAYRNQILLLDDLDINVNVIDLTKIRLS